MRWSALFASALFFTASAHAEPHRVNAPALGIGRYSCREWTRARSSNSEPAKAAAQWFLGFVSGYNVYGPHGKSMFLYYDEKNAVEFMDSACNAHPEAQVMDIATDFISGLARTKKEFDGKQSPR